MNRRHFLRGVGAALIGGVALQQAIPLNRVWSFPSEIIIPPEALLKFAREYGQITPEMMNRFDLMWGFAPLVPEYAEIEITGGRSHQPVGGAGCNQ